jgi:hypothetical protein
MKEEQLKKLIADADTILSGLASQKYKEGVQEEPKKESPDTPVIDLEAHKQVTDCVYTKIID